MIDEKTRLLVYVRDLIIDDIEKTDTDFVIYFSVGWFKTVNVRIPLGQGSETLKMLLDNSTIPSVQEYKRYGTFCENYILLSYKIKDR